ncbi:MAG: class I SAM-dependent methyltransferase [Gammaproteobacteria bacterium]
MAEPEFDRYASSYRELHAANIRITGESPDYFAEYKVRHAARLAGARLPSARILDFGCGIGNSTVFLARHFPVCEIAGTDVSGASLEVARSRAPGATFAPMRDDTIPFPDAHFGLAFVSCVLHHVPPESHPVALAELRRVLAPGGWLAVYEHNPTNPLTVRAVESCEFDRNAVLIPAQRMRRTVAEAGFGAATIRFVVFFPRLLALLRFAEPALAWLPLGAQYCVMARR